MNTFFVWLCALTTWFSVPNGRHRFLNLKVFDRYALTTLLSLLWLIVYFTATRTAKLSDTDLTGISGVSGRLFTGEKVRKFQSTEKRVSSRPNTKSAFVDEKLSHCKHWAVCTTIFEASEAIHDVCNRLPSYCLIVVADLKTREPFKILGRCTFVYYSVVDQQRLSISSSFASSIPWNHFGRKNLGYLFALANGATRIWDFDDDNLLFSSEHMLTTGQSDEELFVSLKNSSTTSLNPYPLFGAEHFSWPRGFPLELIKNTETTPTKHDIIETIASPDDIGVVQALANNDPDVDAIYRLQRELPFNFKGLSRNHALFLTPLNSYTPWNAQATLFRSKNAMWCAYLPISVHGRVSDIWRSLIAQRIFRETCTRTTFMTEATVRQNRNPHSYLADFDAEQDLYYKSGKLIEFLNRWQPPSVDLATSLKQLYVELFERDFVGRRDVEMIQLWLVELKLMKYEFPVLGRCTKN